MFNYILALCTAFFLARLSNRETELHNPSFGGYLFAILQCVAIAFDIESSFVTLFLLLTYYPLCESYQNDRSEKRILLLSLYFGAASVFYPPIIWMLPVFWIAFANLRILTLKTLLASILGIAVVWTWTDTIKLVWGVESFPSFSWGSMGMTFGGYSTPTSKQWLLTLASFIMFLVGWYDYMQYRFSDKSRTRTIYQVFILQGAFIFFLLILQPKMIAYWLPLSFINTSFMFNRFLNRII